MKKTYFLQLAFILFSVTGATSQGGVAINNGSAPPDSSAVLDVSSSLKGELMPRMNTAQRNAIVKPAEGLTIYNTDCHVYNFNAGTPAAPNWATINSSNALAAGVSITASPAGAICAGTSVTFSATPSQNNLSPAYQWQINGNNIGTNSSTFTDSILNSGDVVTCILTSNVNCVTGSPATSNAITMLVNIVPSITGTTPAGFCSGSAVTLTASANLGTINWYNASAGGSSLSSGASFTVSGLNASATYYVDATANGCTTAVRTPVTATFYPNAPGQPGSISGSANLNKNDTAIYSISPLNNVASYAWTVYPPGVIISGQGSASITVVWGDSTAITMLSVASTNPCGSSAAQTKTIYVSTEVFNATDTLLYGFIQNFTVPAGVSSLIIDAYGAQGGSGNGGYGSSAYGCNCSLPGGMGAEIKGTVNVTPGDVIRILVGQAGGGYGGGQGNQNGGGGGSFVVDQTSNTLLIVAGGGGGGPSTTYGTNCSRTPSDGYGQTGQAGATPGCAQCGCSSAGGTGGSGGNSGNGSYAGGGGGGYTGNGGTGQPSWCSLTYGGMSYTNGGAGGIGATCNDPTGINTAGGFGGGGGGGLGGPGGGGGYSGGGTIGSWSSYSSWGGGGGSYNSGTNQTNNAGVQPGQGIVIFSW